MPVRLYILALGAFALITTELGMIGILPQISQAFHVTISKAGWLLSGFALMVALAGPPMAIGFSRVDRKLSLCMVLALFTLSNIACAFAPKFNWLLLFRVLPALVHPVFWSFAMTVAASSVSPSQSHRAVGIVFIGMSAGIVLGIPLASWLTDMLGWRSAFQAFSLLNGVALLAHVLSLPRLPVDHPLAIGAQLGTLRKPVMWWNLAVQVMLTGAAFATYGYIAQYLRLVPMMKPGTVSTMLFVFGLVGVAGTVAAACLIGRGLDRAVLVFLATLPPVWLLLVRLGHDARLCVALIVVWGFIHAATVPLCQAIVLRAGADTPEFFNSLFNSFGNIGITLGTSLGGVVIAYYGITSLPLCGIALLLFGGCFFFLERARYRPAAQAA